MSRIRTVVKRALVGVAAFSLVGVGALVVKFYVLSPRSRPAPSMTAPTSPEAVERGRYLAEAVAACVGCHSSIDESRPGEPLVPNTEGQGRDFGDIGGPVHIRAPNITPDVETGIGGWSDGEVARAVREGVRRDGRGLFPQMPYLTYGETLSDADLLDIIAYLKTLPPKRNVVGETSVAFPVSMFIRAVPRPIEASPPPSPPSSDTLARGEWLLRVASCTECHDTVNERNEKVPGMRLAGGMKFSLPDGRGHTIAPNITSDEATGIGSYSDDDVLRALEQGKGKDGRDLYTMPWQHYRKMTSEDKRALVVALRKAAAVTHLVPPSSVAR